MRNAFHVIISLLLWCLFGYYWFVVSRRQFTRSSLEALVILGLVILVGLAITIWWISHNKKLARRNRRNTPPPTVPEIFDVDSLGRQLVRPEVRLLQAAQVIEIDVEPAAGEGAGEAGRKFYSVRGKDDR